MPQQEMPPKSVGNTRRNGIVLGDVNMELQDKLVSYMETRMPDATNLRITRFEG